MINIGYELDMQIGNKLLKARELLDLTPPTTRDNKEKRLYLLGYIDALKWVQSTWKDLTTKSIFEAQ